MRAHISNSVYGVLDYVAQPVGMLVAAPILLHHLGVASYGLWLVASAAVSAGAILSSGFGDAVILRIAPLRASKNTGSICRVVANLLAINLLLGNALASVLWLCIPFATSRITKADPALHLPCLWSLRIGAMLIVIKSVESVFISAQRACERYRPAVRISVTVRLLIIAISVILALRGVQVVALMISTSALTTVGAIAQWAALRRHLGVGLLRPTLDRSTWSPLASFGTFSWLQAVSGVIFSQADRLILGTTMGASAVAYYGVCVAMAQPIHGLTAAGLHFIFPHLATRFQVNSPAELRRPLLSVLGANLLATSFCTAAVALFGARFLTLWLGASFAGHSITLLPLLAIGFGLLGLNVTAHYTLMALGRVRLVAAVSVLSGLLMPLLLPTLIRQRGLDGAGVARLCYGAATLLLYLPWFALFRSPGSAAVQLTRAGLEQA